MAAAWARRPAIWLAFGALALAAFALLRAPDHDESQYVAAAVLTADGLLPFRDFAWLQTPLQPFAFAPLAWLFGAMAWPGLRLVNAALGLAALAGVYRAGRVAGARPAAALAAAALFGGCDAFLFGAATARNDMLPLALLAWSLVPAVRLARGDATRGAALMAGLLLGAAASAKVSYAIPAAAFGLWCLLAPGKRQAGWVALGAVPAAALVAGLTWLSPHGFWFGAIAFPLDAPADFYRDRPDKLLATAKALDLAKFLALGAAPIALAAWRPARSPVERLLDLLLLAGLFAAVLPTPVWRQYLLPFLAPLFVRAALAWQERPPARVARVALVVFAAAGLAPALLLPWGFTGALRQGRALRTALDANRVAGPVATLSPQFLPATGRAPDPRFAAGPFVFRSRALLSRSEADALRVVTQGAIPDLRPRAVLVGGEGAWTAGDIRLDRALARAALRQGYRAVPVPGGRFVLLLARTPS